jgi:hypothetical protein
MYILFASDLVGDLVKMYGTCVDDVTFQAKLETDCDWLRCAGLKSDASGQNKSNSIATERKGVLVVEGLTYQAHRSKASCIVLMWPLIALST